MDSKGRNPSSLEGRAVQAPSVVRHFPVFVGQSPLAVLPHSDLLGHQIAAQAADIELLTRDNRTLATTHVALRQDLVVAQEEVERLKSHIRSIHTESDIQIRVLLDKIAKWEEDIAAGVDAKKKLKEARAEAQNLAKARKDLTAQIQQASEELQRVRADAHSLPDLHTELENSRQELRQLRETFEYEKSSNIEKVKQLKAKEQNLIQMAREVEMLQAEVLNAENKARASKTVDGGCPNPSLGPPVHIGGAYVDAYGRPINQMDKPSASDGIVQHGAANGVAVDAGAPVSSVGGVTVWGGSLT